DCGHADQVRSQGAERFDLRRRFEAGPGDGEVDSFGQFSDGVCQLTQTPGIRLAHVEEPFSEALIVWAGNRIAAGEVDVIGDQDQLALPEVETNAAGRVGADQG